MPGKSFDRAVRKEHIRMGFVNRYRNGKREEVTSSKVARSLMLEPSAHVRGLLGELVRDGIVSARKVEDKRASNLKGENAFTVYYQLSESEIKKIEEEARSIEVKKGGVSVGQLRMF